MIANRVHKHISSDNVLYKETGAVQFNFTLPENIEFNQNKYLPDNTEKNTEYYFCFLKIKIGDARGQSTVHGNYNQIYNTNSMKDSIYNTCNCYWQGENHQVKIENNLYYIPNNILRKVLPSFNRKYSGDDYYMTIKVEHKNDLKNFTFNVNTNNIALDSIAVTKPWVIPIDFVKIQLNQGQKAQTSFKQLHNNAPKTQLFIIVSDDYENAKHYQVMECAGKLHLKPCENIYPSEDMS